MLDLHQIEVLRAAARRGSIAGAASSLGLSASTVSHHIARLEESAGVELLIRYPRGVRLTGAGEAVLRHGEVAIEQLAIAERELGDRRAARVGPLLVAGFPTAFIDLIPRAVLELRRRGHPPELRLSCAPADEALHAVLVGEADVGVTFSPADESESTGEVRRTVLLDDPMMLILPTDHPLADEPTVSLQSLGDAQWIMGHLSGTDSLTMEALRRAGIEPNVLMLSPDLLAIQGLVAAGLGVALNPALGLRHTRRDVVVRALREPVTRRIEVVTRLSDRRPAVARLVEALAQAAVELA